ncbi:MAG TPA: hypothetical protein VME46_21695 [Acidimicrobiales bacterium]|nr:hypothetical protein [Acidimicrobiales bacterium]
MPPDPSLHKPWTRPEAHRAHHLENEAQAEIGPQHELAGRARFVVAACSGCARVIFRADDDSFAIVNLTWSGQTEPEPWPATQRLGGFLAVESAADAHSH